ncbi:hypothetical protein ACH4D4_08255 [Streptomyces pristinaespiralis]|uniref:hypothetical protein n=1 Tax=Streptomyces pristinaespiralis TaxID=38300 RepID=UPI0037AB357B
MHADLTSLIAATAQWMSRAFPSGGGVMDSALAHAQAHQAVTVAASLRYPTPVDAALVAVAGSGGSARLDWITGSDAVGADDAEEYAWRTWVDEVVASWAACLLGDPELATTAVAALHEDGHGEGTPSAFRRLVTPDERDRRAGALLRHPDLLEPVARLHRSDLLTRLGPSRAMTG